MSNTFDTLPEALVRALGDAFGIFEPLAIQEDAIPHILAGENVVLQSRTGSGKTLAYTLPLLAGVKADVAENQLLIVAPTQELSVQIATVIRELNKHLEVPYGVVVANGGANIARQIERLKKRPPVIVGTPGRLLELFSKKKINAQTIRAVVFDEVDAIIEQEHGRLMRDLTKALLRRVQVVCASASVTMENKDALNAMFDHLTFLLQTEEAALNPNIGHFMLHCEARKKFDNLRHALALMDGKTLVFINGEDEIAHLQDRLAYHKIQAGAISGEMKKLDRQKALEDFRKSFEGVLISSDLSARGLDIADIDQVINMDFPHDPMTYVHRVGRTARGDREGAALSFISERDEAVLRIYARDLGVTFTEVHFEGGALVEGPAPVKAEKKAKKDGAAPAKKREKHRARDRKNKGKPTRKKSADTGRND